MSEIADTIYVLEEEVDISLLYGQSHISFTTEVSILYFENYW
jgi:hypothetical protein